MSERSSAAGGGVGFFGLLTLIFVTLKLTGFINWSWWWVLSPLWMLPVIVFVLILALVLIEGRRN